MAENSIHCEIALFVKTYIFITPFFPSAETWRGCYGYDLANAIAETGKYKVVVFVPGNGDDYVIGSLPVYRFKTRSMPCDLFPAFMRRLSVPSFMDAVKRAGIPCKDVAVCHCNNVLNGYYGLALRSQNPNVKVIVHHHDLSSFGLRIGRFRHLLIQKIPLYFAVRRILETVDLNVFISRKCMESCLGFPDTTWSSYEDYRKLGRGLSWLRKVHIRQSYILHNGVDTQLFNTRNGGGRGKEAVDFRIGCIANFEPCKDQITLLRAFALVAGRTKANVKLIFVGSGSTMLECRRYVDEHGLGGDVEFRSEVGHEALPRFYHDIDLFVLPSYFEGFGCVYTEAWCCGVPFIGCENQGIGDVIHPNDAHLWLCKERDAADLAEKILYFIENKPRQQLVSPVDLKTLVGKFIEEISC